MTQSKNTLLDYSADVTNLTLNSEYTWTRNQQNALTFGLGYNKNSDKINPAQSLSMVIMSMRYSYSF
jgi:hemolysin activation/secretion protein